LDDNSFCSAATAAVEISQGRYDRSLSIGRSPMVMFGTTPFRILNCGWPLASVQPSILKGSQLELLGSTHLSPHQRSHFPSRHCVQTRLATRSGAATDESCWRPSNSDIRSLWGGLGGVLPRGGRVLEAEEGSCGWRRRRLFLLMSVDPLGRGN